MHRETAARRSGALRHARNLAKRGTIVGAARSESGGTDATAPTLPAETALTLSDTNPVMAATPYPFYASGGQDDNADRAVLISHTGASVERAADAGFTSTRSQLVHRDVVAVTKDAAIEGLKAQHAADREHARQFAELRAELAGIRSAQLQAQVDGLRADASAKALDAILTAVKALAK